MIQINTCLCMSKGMSRNEKLSLSWLKLVQLQQTGPELRLHVAGKQQCALLLLPSAGRSDKPVIEYLKLICAYMS